MEKNDPSDKQFMTSIIICIVVVCAGLVVVFKWCDYMYTTWEFGISKTPNIIPDNGHYGDIKVYQEPHGDGTKLIEFSWFKGTKTPIKNGDFYYASGEYYSSCDQNHYHDDIFIVRGRFIDHNHVKYTVEKVYYHPGIAETEFKKQKFEEYCIPEIEKPIRSWADMPK